MSKIFRSEYLKNISIQFLGTGIAQVIPVLFSPILSRLYSEESFATYTLFFSVVAVLIVPVGGRYYLATVISKNEEEVKKLLTISTLLTIFYAITIEVVIVFYYEQLNNFFKLGELWYFLPIYLLVFGLYNTGLYSSVRKKKFKINSLAKIVQNIGWALLSFIFFYFDFLKIGLVLSKLVGVVFSVLVLREKLMHNRSFKELKVVASKYISYPKLTILPSLLDVFSLQALVLFVGKFYSENDLAYLGLTNMVLMAPVALIGTSFRDVFYQKASSLYKDKKYEPLKRVFMRTSFFLLFCGVIFALLCYFFGEFIFELIYSDKWLRSGKFAKVLGISICVKLTVSPLSTIFNVTKTLHLVSFWQITYFVTTCLTLYFTIVKYQFSIDNVLIIYVIHEILLYGFYYFLELNALNKL